MNGCVGNLSVVIVIPLNFSQRKSSIREGESCNVATPNTVVGIFGGPDTHTCILELQRNPFLTPGESNPVNRKMRGRDALNLHGSGNQRFLLSQNVVL
ncbi:hypothetical protein TNCV_26541 [Trichonephila clavipes]|uniref:Uncharacterized protein n=1 Tax=Trichonephila clavipes TaxID=2585209 RepID=A0A8X6WLY7_TRICX|nr:hypothetical protein TNCV_26541 [Trichonephila clavipes]